MHGFKVVSPEFLTRLPAALGEPGGGIANAIMGSLILVGLLATLLAVPVGVLAGVYLAEFGRGILARQVRFWAEVLVGVPSIIVGAAVYGLLVVPMGRFSALAGGVALAIIMIPVVTRTTEEMVRMVPATLREASLALGATRAGTVVSVVLRSARAGILTGTMLAVARAAGETAPLLFTALSSRYRFGGLALHPSRGPAHRRLPGRPLRLRALPETAGPRRQATGPGRRLGDSRDRPLVAHLPPVRSHNLDRSS